MEKSKAKKIAVLGVLAALVILLQCLGGLFAIGGLSLSFVLVPIVLGGVVFGVGVGASLGLIFSLIVFFYGLFGLEPFTAYLLAEFTVPALFTVFVKGIAAGTVSALVYKALKNKNEYAAVVSAAICAPVVNTGLFMVGVLVMGDAVLSLLSITVLFNFLIELAINVVLAPSLYRVIKVVKI